MAFALEQAIDEAALRLKTDPIQLRKRWDPNPDRQRLYDWAAGLETWRRRPAPRRSRGRYRRGVGVAAGLLALSLAARHQGRARGRGRPPRRQHRGAGHRHRNPQRHRRHGRARIRPRSARGRGPHRRFEAAGRPGHPAAAASPHRSCRRSCSPPANSRPASPDRPDASRRAGLERAVAGAHRRLARSQGRGASARRTTGRTAYGNNSLVKDAGLIGLDLRLHDAPLQPYGDRRRGAELGPGHRGRGRYAARPCARAQRPFRHRRRQARRAGAGAQPGRGRASSRAWATRFTRGARSTPRPATF